MSSLQIIRIAALLVVIFVAGFLTGRLTVPKPLTQVSIAGGKITNSDRILAHLTRQLNLTEIQQRQFATVLENTAGELIAHPPGTPERLAVFRASIPKMAALLQPEQKSAFGRYVQDTEMKFQRAIRNRNLNQRTNSNNRAPVPAQREDTK